MANVSLIDPYSQKAEEIANRRRMAQALQEQGSQILDMPTTPGVAISPYAGLAKVLQAGLGAYEEKQARKEYADLQTDYRNKYNTQFENFARALSAPAQEAFAGQEAVPGQEAIAAQPAVMASQIEKSFGGYGMPQKVEQYEVSPAVAGKEAVLGQAAIPARPAVPAGYISPEMLSKIDIPEVKQLAMAKYLQQFEPKDIKLGQGDTLYRQVGSGPLVEQAVGKTAAKTAERPIVLGEGQNAYDPTGKLLVTGPAKTQKAEAKAPVWKEVVRGGKIYYEDFNNPDTAARQAGAIEKEAFKTTPHYSEIEQGGNVVIVDMNLPADKRLANAQIKGPVRNNLEKIETNDENGKPVTRYVDKAQLATLGDIPGQYKGFMSDMAEAGQLPKNWQSIPQIAGLVRENLINKAGGITQADLASLKIRIAEAASRLAYEGVPGFNPAGLTPPLPNFTTLQGNAPAAAAGAETKITTLAEIAEAAKRSDKSIEQVTRDAVAKGYKVQ
jgi:hypothetical protein